MVWPIMDRNGAILGSTRWRVNWTGFLRADAYTTIASARNFNLTVSPANYLEHQRTIAKCVCDDCLQQRWCLERRRGNVGLQRGACLVSDELVPNSLRCVLCLHRGGFLPAAGAADCKIYQHAI